MTTIKRDRSKCDDLPVSEQRSVMEQSTIKGNPVKKIGPGWQWNRERMHRHIIANPLKGIPEDEISAHFEGMPERYWETVSESELVWGLQSVHRFLHGNAASSCGDTAVVLNWRFFPYQGYTKVLVCSWDRVGLLTQLAGYVSALRLNIVRAEVFTRADNIVLDVFWLSDGENRHVSDEERLRKLAFLVEGGLCDPPRFSSEWACEFHKFAPLTPGESPVIHFNNEDAVEHTIITIVAAERLGLLHDMLKVFTQFSLNVTEALIDTSNNVAHDTILVSDRDRHKITSVEKLNALEQALKVALIWPIPSYQRDTK